MAAAPHKYRDLFRGKLTNTAQFPASVGKLTLRVERYGNSPLFATGVLESEEAFGLRTLVLAYLWPQFFVPFMAFQNTRQAVSSVALNVPPLTLGYTNPRTAFARSLAGDAAWRACLAAADDFVARYCDALVPVTDEAGLTADDPVIRAVAAVLRDFQRLYDAQKGRMAVIGLASMYHDGIADAKQVTRRDDIDRMMDHMRRFDSTEFYGRVGDTFATAVSALFDHFETERLRSDDIDAVRTVLAAYLGVARYADVEHHSAAGLAALRTLVIPTLPRTFAPISDDTAAQRMIVFVHKLSRISYFNSVATAERRPGLFNTTIDMLKASAPTADRNQLISILTAEKIKPVRTVAVKRRGARAVAAGDDEDDAPPASSSKRRSSKGARVRASAKAAADSDDDVEVLPAPSPKRRVADDDELGGAGMDEPEIDRGEAAASSSADAAARAADAARMERLSPSTLVVGTPGVAAPSDEVLASLFYSAAPNRAADDADAPPLMSADVLEAAIANFAVSYGLEPRGLQTTPHVASPAQTPSAAAPIVDDDVMEGLFDVDGFWVLLSLMALRGHPFGMLGYSADRWIDIVIGWHAQAARTGHDAFVVPPTREFWQRAGVGAMLADTERAQLRGFAEHVIRARPELVAPLTAQLAATTAGTDEPLNPLTVARRRGITSGPIVSRDVDNDLRTIATHTYQMALDAVAQGLEQFADAYAYLADPLAGIDYWTARAAPSPLSSSSSSLRPVTPASPAASPTAAPAPALYNTRDAAQSLLDYARATLGGGLPDLARIGLEHGRIRGRPASNWLVSAAQ